MKKYIIFIFAIFVILFFIGLKIHELSKKPLILKNVTEVQSYFTPYLLRTVEYKLKSIEYFPDSYYYNNSYICFIGNAGDACFQYAWVEREKSMMNYMGISYFTGKDLLTKFYFNSYGIAKLLECDLISNVCIDNIKIKLINNDVIFIFPENLDIEKYAISIAQNLFQTNNCMLEQQFRILCDNNSRLVYFYYGGGIVFEII